MILHTMVNLSLLVEQPPQQKLQTKMVGTQYVQGVQSGQGFVINRIISTNLKDYLNYTPGDIYQ
ncbi:MAG: YlzJ-like family protein [Oscillospiraceae bacterium]